MGLTQVQYSILAATSYLESAEHVTQQNVSDQLSMDKMIVSDVVKTLEKRNFLTRKPRSGPDEETHPYLRSLRRSPNRHLEAGRVSLPGHRALPRNLWGTNRAAFRSAGYLART
ncbi:MAG: hypothetical protein DMF75_12540 [Acidobacteria bacterium]|nr:MAG: hypothetical protein DMF75_12540 [Acidobacteriota bacterium]